jgi:mono/diheme cytochrome c family protein
MRRHVTTMMLAAAALVCSGLSAGAASPALPEGWHFTLPSGTPSAGRAVYERMDCSSCHALAAMGAPREGRGKVGPALDGYGKLPPEYLAESIIRAHKVVAAPGYAVEQGKAIMGNYNHFLTVQELIDLVAFLRAEAGAKP